MSQPSPNIPDELLGGLDLSERQRRSSVEAYTVRANRATRPSRLKPPHPLGWHHKSFIEIQRPSDTSTDDETTQSNRAPITQGRTAEPRIPRFAREHMPDAADPQPMDEGANRATRPPRLKSPRPSGWRHKSFIEIQRPSDSSADDETTQSNRTPITQGRTAEPRIPRFAWERMPDAADTQPMDEGSRTHRIQAAKIWALVKTVFTRLWILALFVGYNGYSFYMAAGDIHNTVVIFNPRLRTQGTEADPMQLNAGAFTYIADNPRDRHLECWLVMLAALITKFVIWCTMMIFLIVCLHWKAEPSLYLPDLLPDRNAWPTVDIILPRYKEAWESFEPTVRATIASSASEAAPVSHKPRHYSTGAQSKESENREVSTTTPPRYSVLQQLRLPWMKSILAPSKGSDRSGSRPSGTATPSHQPTSPAHGCSEPTSPKPPQLRLHKTRHGSLLWPGGIGPPQTHCYSFTALMPTPAVTASMTAGTQSPRRRRPCASKVQVEPKQLLPPQPGTASSKLSVLPCPGAASPQRLSPQPSVPCPQLPASPRPGIASPQGAQQRAASPQPPDAPHPGMDDQQEPDSPSLPVPPSTASLQLFSPARLRTTQSQQLPTPCTGPTSSQKPDLLRLSTTTSSSSRAGSKEQLLPEPAGTAHPAQPQMEERSGAAYVSLPTKKAASAQSSSFFSSEEESAENPFYAYGKRGVTMDYPPSKLNIYICDDGSRDPATSIAKQVQQLSASLPPGSPKVHYITRENGFHAKGGNLNNCLKHARGELLAVFDADHIASPEFLLWTVPHFLKPQQEQPRQDIESLQKTDAATEWTLKDSSIGLCQTKQFFYNEHDLVPHIMGADNKIYYYLYQHGLSGMHSATCVGTGYVMRRKALDDAGGYVGGFAVEDSFTSTSIVRAGWKAIYIPDCLAMGLSPPTLSEHVQQRWRWSIGNVQLLFYGKYGDLPLAQQIGVIGGNWYPLAVSAVFCVIIYRLVCFVVYALVATPQQTSATQVATSWLALFILFVMPNIDPFGKLFDIIGLLVLVPVFLGVLAYSLAGRLDPARNALPKIKAASEAQGDVQLPPNVLTVTLAITCLIIAVILIQLAAPENANVELGFALTVSVLAILVLIVVSVYLILFHGLAVAARRQCRRLLKRAGLIRRRKHTHGKPAQEDLGNELRGQSITEVEDRRVGE